MLKEHDMNMKKYRTRRFVKFAILAILVIPLFGFIVMGLWNWLMPDLFGLPRIGFWQAWGLFVLGKILFGSFRGQPGGHHRARMGERWAQMSDDEREAFRRGIWRHREHPHAEGSDTHDDAARP